MLDLLNEDDWKRIRDSYEAWWTRKLERPVIHLCFTGRDPGMKRPEGLITEQFHNLLDNTPEQVAEKMEYIWRSMEFALDAYPYTWMYFGPLWYVEQLEGIEPVIQPATVWFKSDRRHSPSDLRIRDKKESVFASFADRLERAFDERFGRGNYVRAGLAGGGCCLDEVVSFFPSTESLTMLYDYPDDVIRLCNELHDLEVRRSGPGAAVPGARGYTGWGGIYAPVPWVMSQCDFSSMIGPEHFRKFVLWDLERAINESPRYNYYHMDGSGELPHLDMLLGIKNLKCIQWVPGSADPPISDWPQLYRRISEAGKNIWVVGDLTNVEKIADHIGTAKGLYWYGAYPIERKDEMMKIADRLMKS